MIIMKNKKISTILSLLILINIVNAITKKSDDGSSMMIGGGGGGGGNQPIYQGSQSYSMSNQYGGGGGGVGVNNQQLQHELNQQPQQQQSQSQSQQQQQSQGSQSNLYYYYYPVQDQKQKDTNSYLNGGSVGVGNSLHQQNIQSGHHQNHDNIEHGSVPLDTAASGSEISYSSPELNQDYQTQSQGFDAQTLSNLASQFQQQYFNNPATGAVSAYADAANAANLAAYGNQAEASSHIAQQVHPGYSNALSQGHLAFAQAASPYGPSGQHTFAGYGQGGAQALQPQTTDVSSGGGLASGLKKYGLTSILMPVLAIAGLSLLLPTVTSLGATTTTKTKRSIDDSPFSSYIEKMDTYYKMYNKAMEKEECMNKMICELGDAVSDVRGRSALLMVVENLAPQWMEKKMVVFKNGALSKDLSKCKKYSC